MCEQCENRTTTSGYNMKLHSIYIDPTIKHEKFKDKNKYMLEQLEKDAEKEFDDTFPTIISQAYSLAAKRKSILLFLNSQIEKSYLSGKEYGLNAKQDYADKAYQQGKKEAIEEIKKFIENNIVETREKHFRLWGKSYSAVAEFVILEHLNNYLKNL